MSFILQKKLNELFGQPNTLLSLLYLQSITNALGESNSRVWIVFFSLTMEVCEKYSVWRLEQKPLFLRAGWGIIGLYNGLQEE